jgi:predicted ester cyclase
MNAEQKKERVRQYYEEVWCNGKVDIVDELFAPAYENCDPATPGASIKGREAFKSLVSSYRKAFPDFRLDIIGQYCEGDTVISRWNASVHRVLS